MSDALRRTPLHAEHVAAGAKMVPFAGYEMPVQYPTGITAEHQAVRTTAGLFDVSHMGEFEISGPDALALILHLCSNDASDLEIGQAQYSTLPRADGGLLDDLLVYRLADRYMLVVNAANREKDLAWIQQHARRFDARVVDRSDETALLALQGPVAQAILSPLTDLDLDSIAYYHFAEGEVDGHPALVSRTGYTGEDGFEIYVANDAAVPLWRRLLEQGHRYGLVPAGLGARDSLRLEMGYPLYGNDLDEEHNALEAGLGWVTKIDRPEFIAGEALRRRKAEGVSVRLSAFRMLERAFPRPGYEIASGGEVIGRVTSGTLSPTLGIGIGMGYIPTSFSKPGTAVDVIIRGRPVAAEIVRLPFYSAGSLRR